jgi:hypothetical protein
MSLSGPSAVAAQVRPAKITAVDGVLPMELLLLPAKITTVEEDRGVVGEAAVWRAL